MARDRCVPCSSCTRGSIAVQFSTQDTASAVHAAASYMQRHLSNNEPVLWLTSGGSSVAPQVAIINQLITNVADKLANLTVLPVDERYGEPGHASSNTAQMRAAGFKSDRAVWRDVLSGHTLEQTILEYAKFAEDAFAQARVVVATLGMGADAHTAGLLPGSPAVMDMTSTVVGYTWSDYDRLTLGVPMLLRINRALVLAYGEPKREALERLQANVDTFEDMPAKLLYDLPDVTVYNDYIESEG